LQPGVSKPSPLFSPDGRFAATVVAKRNGNQGTNAIVVRKQSTGATRTIYRVPESYRSIPAGGPGPIMLFRWSADGRRLFFAIDPQGSASIAADGLLLQVISTKGGRPQRIGMTLAYSDYMTWCNRSAGLHRRGQPARDDQQEASRGVASGLAGTPAPRDAETSLGLGDLCTRRALVRGSVATDERGLQLLRNEVGAVAHWHERLTEAAHISTSALRR
jgi:hypothetical protein